MGIALGRDAQAQAQVMRRFYENGLIAEAPPTNIAELQISPGVAMVQARARQVYTEARARIQTSLGTLNRLAEALADARGRKTLLLFSEGFIMDTTLQDFRTLLRAAQNANVAVHFVDVGNPGGDLGQPAGGADVARALQENDTTISMALAAREAEGTRSIAADTGGRTISGSNLLDGLRRIASEGRAYYLLGYSPTTGRREGRFRRIEVSVRNRPDVTVRARGGYFEPSSEGATPRPDPKALNPDVRAGLDSPFGAPGIPMRMTSYVLGPQTGTTMRTLIVAEADVTPLGLAARKGAYSATLESYMLVHDRSRDSLERNERLIELNVPEQAFPQLARAGIPIQREFALGPGTYQATLLLRDRETGTIGSVRHEFEVPGIDQFRITTPVVTDILQPSAAGQPPRPVPIARRTFKAGTRIAVAFDILGAAASGNVAPQVSVSYALRRADGTPVAASPPQPLNPNARGQFAVAIGMGLPPDAAGDHELHVTVRDESAVRIIEHLEPLTIAP
jgi:hypothetical protein